jgi:hypothetical protein
VRNDWIDDTLLEPDAGLADGDLRGVHGREDRMDVDGAQLPPALLLFASHLGIASGPSHGSDLYLRTIERRRARRWNSWKSSGVLLVAFPNLMPWSK